MLEVPTLTSKNIEGKATKTELSQFEFVKDKGLILTQTDVETYDDKGRLASIERTAHTTGLKYLYTYKVSKRGLLEQEKITNAANNQTVRTTDYAYKKGVVTSTTQVQGTVTTVKRYTHDKKGNLTSVKVEENGALKGEEFYLVDEQDRRTQTSQKLPAAEDASIVSTFTYTEAAGEEVKTEIRNVNSVKYKIATIKDLTSERNLKETTINLSNSESGFNDFLYQSDEKGSWVKGEVVDNQLGRSRLILRKITYADGTTGGRTEWSLEDNMARYYRQYEKYQVAYNGKIIETGAAENLPLTQDRLVYSKADSASILLKDYDAENYQSNWHRAEVISNSKQELFWISKRTGDGVEVFLEGKKLSSSPLSKYQIGNSLVGYVAEDIKKSFVVRDFFSQESKGKLHKAALSDHHYYWGVVSDTTYALVGYGYSIGLQKQAEDQHGNMIVSDRAVDQWYGLPNFRASFDGGQPGDIYPVTNLTEPLKQIKEGGVFDADFSAFKYDNLKKTQYRLKTVDGKVVTTLTAGNVRTSDDELIAYFPLTKQYLKMEGYYTAPDDQDILDQPVSVLLQGGENAYYIYNDGASISFYTKGVKVGPYSFGSHKLVDGRKEFGAVLYDSTKRTNYGMNYDLTQPDDMGAMTRLPINQSNAYLLKLENDRWVVFEKGVKVTNYDYTGMDDGIAYYFFKDPASGEARCYSFRGYQDAIPGEFIDAYLLRGKAAADIAVRLKIDPLKPVEVSSKGGGN